MCRLNPNPTAVCLRSIELERLFVVDLEVWILLFLPEYAVTDCQNLDPGAHERREAIAAAAED